MGKLKKEKHNHKLTDFLKVGIFSLVMLAPFISIGSKMAYVTLNKNAKDSYYGETINETIYTPINHFSDMVAGNTYTFNNPLSTATGDRYNTKIFVENFVDNLGNINNLDSITVTMLTFYIYNNNVPYCRLNDLSAYTLSLRDYTYNFTFTYLNGEALTYNDNLCDLFLTQYNKDSYLDNVFEYAVDQIGETPIFAWTKNTAIYTPIETMTNGLGFDPDNNTLAILLTYWSLVTAVYVIMDIILFAFTKITHFTQD